jgi:hypothetical protein
LAEKSWGILAENEWCILAENPWYILAENEWYIYVRKLTSLPVDFTWLFEVAEKLLGLAAFIDAEVREQWITTASPDWDSSDFEAYFLEDFLED